TEPGARHRQRAAEPAAIPEVSVTLFDRQGKSRSRSRSVPQESISLPAAGQIGLRGRLILMRSNLIGINAHHEVGDVVINFSEPVPGARRNNDHVAGLELIGDAIANRIRVAAGSV